MQTNDQKSIILFDGICNLCNASVKFILKRDLKEQFLFASLQSDAAKKILLQYNWKNYQLKSIVLIHDGKVYQKSSAVIKICQQLKWPWLIYPILSNWVRVWPQHRNIIEPALNWFKPKQHRKGWEHHMIIPNFDDVLEAAHRAIQVPGTATLPQEIS